MAAVRFNNIKGFIECSFVDWPGRVCGVMFLGGCNFRCPYCHNHPLVLEDASLPSLPFAEVLERLTPLKKWLGGVCISGGEPTLDPELTAILSKLKEQDWQVKLDTNGSRPFVLKKLLQEQLVDMIAMDIKAPLDDKKYSRCIGRQVNLENIRQSINMIQDSGIDHEFRMTVLPLFHSKDDVAELAARLDTPIKLQNFNPRTTLDPRMAGEEGFSPEIFTDLQSVTTKTKYQHAGDKLRAAS
jgi:pyruvate formate lyase activating enzyme